MKKTSKDTGTSSKPEKKKACGEDCVSPTVCRDLFQGECALEIMSQKMKGGSKPGTADSAPKGKY